MDDKIAIVTGASRGIGRQIAISLAEEGYIVVANYNKSEQKAIELKQSYSNLEIFKADVSKREEVKALVNFTLEKYGKIDVLINNAGISKTQLITDVTDEDWNEIINTNLYSAFCMTQEVVPNMVHNKNGCIINISSIWGQVGASCESVYSISKAGLDAMTKSLAKELGPSNIRVNSIAPGLINTDMNKNLEFMDLMEIKKETPIQRIGEPEDIAKCIKWLIDDKFTTGQVIGINGGWNI